MWNIAIWRSVAILLGTASVYVIKHSCWTGQICYSIVHFMLTVDVTACLWCLGVCVCVQRMDFFHVSYKWKHEIIREKWHRTIACLSSIMSESYDIELCIMSTDKASSIRRSDQCFVWWIFGWWLSCPWICSVFRSEGLPSHQRGNEVGCSLISGTCWAVN